MKTTIRIIGITSIIFLFCVVLTDWEFNKAWIPILLINLGVISILLEVLLRIKPGDRKLVITVLFIVIQAFVIYFSYDVGTILNYKFLKFRTTLHQDDQFQIDRSGGFFGRHKSENQEYILLKYRLGKTLVKEIETIEVNSSGKVCEIDFIESNLRFDFCKHYIYPLR